MGKAVVKDFNTSNANGTDMKLVNNEEKAYHWNAAGKNIKCIKKNY